MALLVLRLLSWWIRREKRTVLIARACQIMRRELQRRAREAEDLVS